MDTPIYERYGDAIVHGGRVPYRDFGVEYPPAALPVFAAPSLATKAGDFPRYERLFEALMLVCGAVAAGLVAFVLVRRRAGRARLVAGTLLAGLAPLALGPVVLSRFDLWPAALTVGALAALVADRRRLAFALLGAAVAAKLYPAVLLPLAVVDVWRRAGRREAAICFAVFAAVLAACVVPFVVVSPSGVWASVSGQATRPLQIESLGASALLAAHRLWGLSLTEVSSHGSDNLVGGLPHALALAQSLLTLAVLAAIWIAFARGERSRDRLLRYCAGAVCAFVAFGKVLSPQYLIWLFALVPLVRGRRGVAAGALFLAAMVVTQLWFPYRYIDLVYALDPRASWLVLARDLLLVALLAALVVPVRAARALGVPLVAGAVAAVGAAAASSASAPAATHQGLLVERGVASRCARGNTAPRSTRGTIAYEVTSFPASRGGRCVRVELSAEPQVQLFSAAYVGRFDPVDPRSGYLGDAGRCTNAPGVAGERVAYGFDAPAARRFAVEVESCSAAGVVPSYVLDVRVGAARVGFRSASAHRIGGDVVVRWRTSHAPGGTVFAVYREQRGLVAPTRGRPISASSSGVYEFVDRGAPLARTARYWIRVQTGAAWSWHGPLTTR